MTPRKTRAAAKTEEPQVVKETTTKDLAPSPSKGKGRATETDEEASKASMSDRMTKFSALRKKMADSSKANRKDVLNEQSRSRALAAARKNSGHSKKLANAEKTLEERDLKESGEDVERHRNFAYSIEDSERWEEKLEEKERKRDKGQIDFQDAAERSYRRQINALKPDMSSYKSQKASLEGGAVVSASSTGDNQLVRREDLYRDASSVYYGDHKPSDNAIDRVVSHLNAEADLQKKRSRKRADDPDEEVNYINKKNKHFNKKIQRYYDGYTKEIRENFERGTAL